MMKISEIHPGVDFRPEKQSASLKLLLMESISVFGFLDNRPIIVTKNGIGYKILDGRARYEAAKALYYEEIPVTIR